MNKVYYKTNEFGNIYWYKEGTNIVHREDGPAIKYYDGTKGWYQNGKYHREDGPAIEYANGDKVWYQNGLLHREDGPAVEYANGDKVWYQNGKRHRTDGPAKEYFSSDKKYYYLNAIYYPDIKTDEEWLIFQIIN